LKKHVRSAIASTWTLPFFTYRHRQLLPEIENLLSTAVLAPPATSDLQAAPIKVFFLQAR